VKEFLDTYKSSNVEAINKPQLTIWRKGEWAKARISLKSKGKWKCTYFVIGSKSEAIKRED
jgi:hypothetical protein